MTQVVESIEPHAGSAGEIVQLVMAPPFVLSVVGDTDIKVPTFPVVPVAPV
jgi:hypothetical protein